MTEGIIFDVKRMSIDDGPGFRTVIFLKGCPLRCTWCHSPESVTPVPQIVYYESKCIGCHECARVCENDVHEFSSDGQRVIHWDRCVGCGACAEICYAEALDIKGRYVTAAEIFKLIERDDIFYKTSGGGVTFSGGEPLMQPDFLLEALILCKNHGLHTALDTSGFADPGVVRRILPFVDLFLFDLKCMDTEKHKQYTGVSNKPILENLEHMATASATITVTLPVIPGYNGSLENVSQTMEFMERLGLREMRLLPVNQVAGSKYKWLGKNYALDGLKPKDTEWIDAVRLLGRRHHIRLTFHK